MKSAKFSHYKQMLDIAIQEAQDGLDEGGIPIGAALFLENGTLLGKAETGVSRKVILPYMEKQMLSVMQGDNDPIPIPLWLQPWHPAGIVAG